MQMHADFVKVNIHNEGRIPWLNIQGPRYNISISSTIYRMLKDDTRVIVYPVDNDPVMRAKQAASVQPAKEKVVAVVEPVVEEVVVENAVEVEPDIVVEEIEGEVSVEEVVETPEYVEPAIMQILEPDVGDLAIEAALEGYNDEDEELVEAISEEEILEEAETVSGIYSYSEDELLQLTKEQLKVILNEDRGFEPGTEFYGRYHDNHDVLVEKVLNSQ